MKIELENSEMLICHTMAVLRNTVSRTAGIVDRKVDTRMSPVEIDRIGFMGELAWAKWRNTYPDFSVAVRSGTEDAVYMDKKIDIKTTQYKNGKLIVSTKKKLSDSDIYVLGIVEGNTVDFVGYISAKDLMVEDNLRDINNSGTHSYVMQQDQLRRFKNE